MCAKCNGPEAGALLRQTLEGVMGLILLLVILVVLFGGGGFYGMNAGWGPHYGYGGIGIGTILVVVLIVLLLRGGL